jgi:hypothetical protein
LEAEQLLEELVSAEKKEAQQK